MRIAPAFAVEGSRDVPSSSRSTSQNDRPPFRTPLSATSRWVGCGVAPPAEGGTGFCEEGPSRSMSQNARLPVRPLGPGSAPDLASTGREFASGSSSRSISQNDLPPFGKPPPLGSPLTLGTGTTMADSRLNGARPREARLESHAASDRPASPTSGTGISGIREGRRLLDGAADRGGKSCRTVSMDDVALGDRSWPGATPTAAGPT